MVMGMNLPKFYIYQGTGATNCFKSHTNLDVLIFFKKKFCLMSGLKFTLSDATSLLPDDLPGLKSLKKLYSDLRQSHEFSENEQMQMVFTTEELLEVAIESWSE